jgi:hypothetical protein
MESSMKKLMLTAAVAAMIGGAGAALADTGISTNLLGEPARDGATADRTMSLDSSIRYITVTQGETVKFVVNGKEFSWVFDGVPSSFNLDQVAPAGTFDHTVRVTVEPFEDGA